MSGDTEQHGDRPTLLGLSAAAAALTLVMLRVLITFAPQMDYLADLRQQRPVTEFGPAALAITDLLMVGVLVLSVADTLMRRSKPRWGMLAMWSVGFVMALLHCRHDPESLRLSGNWTAALAVGVAAAHLAEHPRVRRLLMAGLIALVFPLAGQALHQVVIEQPATMANYERMKAAGELPAMSAEETRKFEQRLYQVEATGRIGFSNVFATIAAALALLALGGAAAAWRDPRGKWLALTPASIAVAMLALTFSKGGVVAFIAAGAAVGVMAIAAARVPASVVRRALPIGVCGVVAIGVVAVLARGAMGEPDSAAGERSLLFRWHYWQAAMRMIEAHPIFGVSPGGFGAAYLTAKNPLNPEEVSDPHNVFVTLISTMGVGGWAWVGVIITLLISAARRQVSLAAGMFITHERWSIAAVVGVVVFGVQYFMELPRYDAVAAVVWLGGAAAWVLFAATLMNERWLDAAGARWGLLAAATAAVLHAQIEMSLTNAMSGPLLMLLVGIAGARSAGPRDEAEQAEQADGRRRGRWVLWALGSCVMAMLAVQTAPTVQRQNHLLGAAEAMARGEMLRAIVSHLDPAQEVILGGDTETASLAASLWLDVAIESQRRGDKAQRDEAIEAALARATTAEPPYRPRVRASVLQQAAKITGDNRLLTAAVDAAAQALVMNPYSSSTHVWAAEIAAQAGDEAKARAWRRRALELDALMYLDPQRQFTADERQRLEAATR